MREGPTSRDPETLALLFDTIRRQVNPEHGLRRPTTFQWEFTDPDVPTWHLTVNNGSSAVEEGAAPSPDLRLRLSYQDWVDIVGERLDPLHAVATGRLRPRGNPLALRKLTRVFPQGLSADRLAGRELAAPRCPPAVRGRQRPGRTASP